MFTYIYIIIRRYRLAAHPQKEIKSCSSGTHCIYIFITATPPPPTQPREGGQEASPQYAPSPKQQKNRERPQHVHKGRSEVLFMLLEVSTSAYVPALTQLQERSGTCISKCYDEEYRDHNSHYLDTVCFQNTANDVTRKHPLHHIHTGNWKSQIHT